MSNKTVGIVLEGGAMRGMYTSGVLDTLLKYGVHADKMIGVSAGALFGINFYSNQPGRVIRYSKKYNHDKNYMGPRPLLREGNIVSTDYAYNRVPRELDPFDDETFKNCGGEFTAVITNIKTGKAEYVHIKSVFEQMDTLRASGSMPFFSRPVKISGNKYLDGAIADSIPFQWMLDQGLDKNIVILTQDKTYVKKPTKPKWYKLTHPKFAEALANRHIMYNKEREYLEKLEAEGKVFVVRPSKPMTISHTEIDPDKLQEAYDFGVSDAENIIEDLKKYLEN